MTLNLIKTLLEQEEYGCTLVPQSEEIPTERLLVYLGADEKKRERLLEIVVHQPLPNKELPILSETEFPARVQFAVKLPFKVQDLSLNQIASLLLFLNPMLDLPGFELNELEGSVTYRYVWLIQPDDITPLLLMSILGAIMLSLGLFSEMIESVAEGKKTFNDLLEEIVKFNKSSDNT